MTSRILFFPPSYPGESLNSRVSRYHILSGNTAFSTTVAELFERAIVGLSQVIPPNIDVLAAGLPGDAQENLKSIILENTLFPLFLPFIGKAGHVQNAAANWYGGEITHMPRRVVGKHGETFLCLDCLHQDETEFGLAYWHREHQAPGVTVCWRHNSPLISSCPNCSFPFEWKNRPLIATWSICRCGHDLRSTPLVKSSSRLEHDYAVFVQDLITGCFAPVPPDILANTYRDRIKEKGFGRQSHLNIAEFTDSMIESLGAEFIGLVDLAFSSKKTRFWLRFHTIGDSIDMPITRHILLGMYLFGSAAKMMQAVDAQIALGARTAPSVKKTEDLGEKTDQIRDAHRKRIALEMKRDPSISMEGLWKKALRATEWLFDNDKIWLERVLAGKGSKAKTTNRVESDLIARQDKEFANLIEQQARRLLEKSGKPERITQEKLLDCVPVKIQLTPHMREKYPCLFARLAQCRETSWCFGARRILWSMAEIKRNEQTASLSNIRIASAVGYHAVRQILEFTAWDGDAMVTSKMDIPLELAKVGIGLAWKGPAATDMTEIGGRRYLYHRPERSNKNVDAIAGLVGASKISAE